MQTIGNHPYYLLGHRGARAEFLENSESGFAHVQTLQHNQRALDGVEFDVQMTTDGQLVVVHDANLCRLANRQSEIADLPLLALSKITQTDFVRNQQQPNTNFYQKPITALADLLPYLQNFNHIELEVKTTSKTEANLLVNNLLRLLSSSAWQALPITITSFDTAILTALALQQVSCTKHRYKTGLLLEASVNQANQIAFLPLPNTHGTKLIYQTCNLACELGCQQLGVYYPLITPTLIDIAQRFDLAVSAWTVNDIATAQRLLGMGVNCIITDYPSEFLANLS